MLLISTSFIFVPQVKKEFTEERANDELDFNTEELISNINSIPRTDVLC